MQLFSHDLIVRAATAGILSKHSGFPFTGRAVPNVVNEALHSGALSELMLPGMRKMRRIAASPIGAAPREFHKIKQTYPTAGNVPGASVMDDLAHLRSARAAKLDPALELTRPYADTEAFGMGWGTALGLSKKLRNEEARLLDLVPRSNLRPLPYR